MIVLILVEKMYVDVLGNITKYISTSAKRIFFFEFWIFYITNNNTKYHHIQTSFSGGALTLKSYEKVFIFQVLQVCSQTPR